MNPFLIWLVVLTFGMATGCLAVYGLHLYVLLFLFRRRSKEQRASQHDIIESFASRPDSDWPVITSQIPLFNELQVARRVMEAVALMDYPAGQHEIQVLDDSNDETREIVDQAAADLRQRGYDVTVVRRADRRGYKAGALAIGLEQCRGEFVSVFDADFVPPTNFLRRAVPLLVDAPDLACLQGRWAHLNEGESWLTKAQALGIDGHFAIEQGARAWNGLMMNFNGTAGIWRKAAIDDPDVGGWSGDTLTEDLDLSYRAQLAGWRIDYCLDLPCPAELPGTVPALKSQQRRWATGSIQVSCKLLPRIWRHGKLSFGQKLEATLHLTHYSVALWMLMLAVIARPMLLLASVESPMLGQWLWAIWIAVCVSAVAPSLTYAYARHSLGGGFSGIRTIPSMLVVGMGLCVSNAAAVLRGMVLKGGEFVRTPKSGSLKSARQSSSYRPLQDNLWLVELALGVYCGLSFVFYITHFKIFFSIFLFLYAVGFLIIGWKSKPTTTPKAGPSPEAPDELRSEHAEAVPAAG